MNKKLNTITTIIIAALLNACSFENIAKDNNFPEQQKIVFDEIRQQNPEAQLGQLEHPKVLENYGGIYESEKLNSLLASILGRLIAKLDNDAPAFSITVLDSPEINAFALPGGYLYITRGLIALANDESEIAAVLTHEISHVQERHGLERTRELRNVSIVERVVNEVVSNEVAGSIAKASAQQKLVVFSQAQELQADKNGIDILAKANFDTMAATRMLSNMQRFNKWKEKFVKPADDIYNYHPPTKKRIEVTKKYAQKYKTNEIIHLYTKENFLEKIADLPFGDKENEGIIRNNQFLHAKLNITFQVPDNFQLFNRTEAIVAIGPNEEALRFDAVNIPASDKTPQDYIQSGWVKGLLHESIVREKINFFNAATAFSQTDDWQFAIAVIEVGQRYFRFVLAAPRKNNKPEKIITIFNEIIKTFRALSQYERDNAKTTKIKIHKISPQDTLGEILSPMTDLANNSELFKALNGLNTQQAPKTHDIVKIISP